MRLYTQWSRPTSDNLAMRARWSLSPSAIANPVVVRGGPAERPVRAAATGRRRSHRRALPARRQGRAAHRLRVRARAPRKDAQAMDALTPTNARFFDHHVPRSQLAGRPVHNQVTTKLVLSPKGELLSRTDDFDTGEWLAQAAPLGIGKLGIAKLAVRLLLSDVLKS